MYTALTRKEGGGEGDLGEGEKGKDSNREEGRVSGWISPGNQGGYRD